MKCILLTASFFTFVISTAFVPAAPTTVNNRVAHSSLNNDFAFLRAHRQGNSISISWGMLSTANLSGFDIERTTQDPFDTYSVWEYAGSVPGFDTRRFNYRDMNVLPGTTFYRITARYTDGSSSVSELVSVRIVRH